MRQPEQGPQGDPWHAFGYVVAGVAFYGFMGWLADRWLDTNYLVAVGILFGAVLGIYMTFVRFRQLPDASGTTSTTRTPPDPTPPQPQDD